MGDASVTPARRKPVARDFVLLLAALACALLPLFYRSFDSDLVLFSNDAPLGLVSAQSGRDATSNLTTGFWQDLNWLGIEQPSIPPSFSWMIYECLRVPPFSWLAADSPVANAKFYAPTALMFLGFCAWIF